MNKAVKQVGSIALCVVNVVLTLGLGFILLSAEANDLTPATKKAISLAQR